MQNLFFLDIKNQASELTQNISKAVLHLDEENRELELRKDEVLIYESCRKKIIEILDGYEDDEGFWVHYGSKQWADKVLEILKIDPDFSEKSDIATNTEPEEGQ